MKILSKLSVIACLCWATLASCESPDYETGRTAQVNGLMSVTIQIPGNPSKFAATKTGPYEENEEIIVKVPTTDETPLDLTRLICMVNVEHNCYVTPAVGGEMDFTNPYPITVVDALGNKHHNTIRVVPTPPKTKYAKLWEKNAALLNMSSNTTGLAFYQNYLAIQEYNAPIKLYDRNSGEFVKEIPAASTFMMRARTDDAGHLITNRENVYGAGFMVYYYSEETQEHINLLNWTADAGCPDDLGYNMSVKGDVTKGVAYIYGMCPHNMEIYYWKLEDGQLVTPDAKPNVLRYGPAGGDWTSAPMIQRATLEDDSKHYIAYNRYSGATGDDAAYKAKFSMFTPAYEITSLNQDNHEYRILGFNVFNIENETYLALNDQQADTWSGGVSTLSVYDITDPSKMELGPDDAGYDKFCLFRGDWSPYATSYNSWGDLTTAIVPTDTGYDIYIATCVIGGDTSQTTIRMYKMTWYRQ